MIRVLRKRQGLSQDKLAEMVCMTRSSITNIELGKQTLSERTLVAIADALGYTVHVTFRRKKEKVCRQR